MGTSRKATFGIGDGEYDETAAAAERRRLGRALEVKRSYLPRKSPARGSFRLSSDDGDPSGRTDAFEDRFLERLLLDAFKDRFLTLLAPFMGPTLKGRKGSIPAAA